MLNKYAVVKTLIEKYNSVHIAPPAHTGLPVSPTHMGGLGRLAAWHLPSRWAATSNVEVGQTTDPSVKRGSEGRENREGS